MSNSEIEDRLAVLETEVAHLKQQLVSSAAQMPWWEKNLGTFANDPMYEEAMRLGQEYRQSLRANEDIPSEL
jgi:hypothetical protein